MQVTKEPLEPCQVALTIEVEADQVVKAVDSAYREYAKYITVPGFRKGKAPMNFVRQRVPQSDIRQRTAELLVQPAYQDALQQEAIEPYAPPKIELVQLDLTETPFIFKAIVPLAPQVELGPYTGLEIERSKVILTEEDIDKQIERMRERSADFPLAERPAGMGDLLVATVDVQTDEEDDEEDEGEAGPRATMIEIGNPGNIPGINENLMGMSAGETKTFTVTYPEDFVEDMLAGTSAEFTVEVKEVRARELPALDDELAKKISNGKIETLETLKSNLRQDMARNLAENADQAADLEIMKQIISSSTLKFPPVLVQAEAEDDFKQLLQSLERQNQTLDDYLEETEKTLENLQEELTLLAVTRIQAGLILGSIIEKEGLNLTPEDIDAAIAADAERQGQHPAALRALMVANKSIEGLANRVQTKKALDFLRASAIIKDKEVGADQVDPEEIEDAGDNAEMDLLGVEDDDDIIESSSL